MLSSAALSLLLFCGASIAAPAAKGDGKKTEYPAPPGGWASIEYPDGTGENLPYYPPPEGGWENVDYPDGTGENLPHYPPPKGGWESVEYPPGTGEKPTHGKGKDRGPKGPKHGVFTFTSTYHVVATGAEVVNGTTPAPGPKDAVGYFNYGINSKEDTICYNITLLNVVGDYRSPARTATHIHEAAKGASGPPRLAFPNPVGDDKRRVSVGCLVGPFTTGLKDDAGADTGSGFTVAEIEANPAGFFTDAHTVLFSLGVVRGQLG